MNYLSDIIGVLAFRANAVRSLAERRAFGTGAVIFSFGYLVYTIWRNWIYASEFPDYYVPFLESPQFLLIMSLAFLLILYIPALIILGNAFSGDGLGFSISKQEYQSHASVLLPLWGILFLATSPLQSLIPQFIPIGLMEIAFGKLLRSILLFVYTLWVLRRLSYLSWAQALGVFALSWFTLPLLFLLGKVLFALPLFILIILAIWAWQRLRDHFASHANERAFQQTLHSLTRNPKDADAHYQLGLIHFKRGDWGSARRYFESALKIEPSDPDYHYYMGRTYERTGEWQLALNFFEETYRLNPEYGLGDIFREVGKGYLHTGSGEKAKEFLNFFLKKRDSDPEGRYWLAVALQKIGDLEQMRFQLNRILEQARSNPRFFRKENREWIYRARTMLREISKS
jgi:tetratricopeptide (TPR) repeat protein